MVRQIRFIVFLAIVEEHFVEDKMRILVHQKISFINGHSKSCVYFKVSCHLVT